MRLTRRGAVAAAAGLALVAVAGCRPAVKLNGREVKPLEAAPELTGTNWDGQPFHLSDQKGKVAIVFFGYTFCPDVCPFTLAKMKQLYAKLGDERARDVAVVFVSVDPKRDSVEKLAHYVPNFDRRFYGVHLDEAQLEATQDAFDITVQYGQPKDGPGTDSYYYVDHTGTYFVVDKQGNLRLEYSPTAKVDEILPDIETLLAS